MLDFIRICCAVPPVRLGDVPKNAADICAYMDRADANQTDVLVFPELCLTGATCGDLFFQDMLHRAVQAGLKQVLEHSKKYPRLLVILGLPVRANTEIFNCAALIRDGAVLGLKAKHYLSDSESRWFASGQELPEYGIDLLLCADPSGDHTLDRRSCWYHSEALVGVEIGTDLRSPLPPSTQYALDGAEVIVHLAAFPEKAGHSADWRSRVLHQSKALHCIYASCNAGCTESTQDAVFSGRSILAEGGRILAENGHSIATDYFLITDCDLGRIRADRSRDLLFRQTVTQQRQQSVYRNHYVHEPLRGTGELYPLRKLPFIPSSREERRERCLEVFGIQVAGLKRRLELLNAKPVIGISGGLDSTLALLVAVEAMRQLERPISDVHGITMPCFGTSDRTYHNAWAMMQELGITCREIDIKDAVMAHFWDIGHDPQVHNATYENAQARERTQVLMDYAGMVGGIVVGTGDLSELALGWCTYNGDHMSMYGVNASVPKTLIRWIIDTVSETEDFRNVYAVLQDVLDTPISPELLPPDTQGKIAQQTEDLVGPYALHDFFLYYVLRYGYPPRKICHLAKLAFREDFDEATIKKWLCSFYRRFFTQQFKRNCAPDGAAVGSISLAPRSDWKMPSDASWRIWLAEAESL